ncbi:MAG: hypothetical protein QM708_11990 [Propioniciclava sp.]|uniref:hypothetical protein n=1 Tax=Propioniciclava sp. TaxID=2038686 RepID=UPI0039E2866C
MEPITLLTPAAIIALVTLLRDVGLPPKLAPFAAIGIGVALSAATQLWGDNTLWQAATHGLQLGLAASGIYDAARLVGGKLQPTERTP